MHCIALASAVAASAALCAPQAKAEEPARPVALYKGEIGAAAGWKAVSEDPSGVTYLPFEGTFPSKGGRIESPRFKLDKTTDENAWYSLSFEATSATDGYWWVDIFDSAGKPLPDVNSRLYASAGWRKYDVIFPTRPDAAEAAVSFVSKKPVKARNVEVRRLTPAEAAARAMAVYDEGPKIRDVGGDDSWERLPKSRKALLGGKELTVVFLGDSIMNDTWCGGLDALVRFEFPDAKLRSILSVRGSTGCWYYHEARNFEDYVGRYRPGLVVIGGISNWNKSAGQTPEQAEDCLVETVERCRKIGAEVVLCTPAKAFEPRTLAADAPSIRTDYIRRAAERSGAQLWDMTTAPVEAVTRSGKPLGWFNRDEVHSDNRGKALNAVTMLRYFQCARRGREKSGWSFFPFSLW